MAPWDRVAPRARAILHDLQTRALVRPYQLSKAGKAGRRIKTRMTKRRPNTAKDIITAARHTDWEMIEAVIGRVSGTNEEDTFARGTP